MNTLAFITMAYNPDIFRVYDIRGVYGKDFDTDFAFQLGAALVEFLNRKKILIAYDDQKFSRELADSVTRGVISMGADAELVGLSSTPFFNYVFLKIGADGGIMVTASHLTAEYAGFKIYGKGGEPIDVDSGLEIISQFVKEGNFETIRGAGKVHHLDRRSLLENCMDYVMEQAGVEKGQFKNLRIKVDAPPTIKEKINYVLEKLEVPPCDSVCDISFTFDRDADRILVFDKQGNRIPSDFIVGLLVQSEIGFWHKPKVVYDLRFSRGVLEKLKEWKLKTYRSRVGRTFTRDEMIKHKIDIGGELSGHIFFKETYYSEAPILAMLKIIKIMATKRQNINQLVSQFQTWSNSGEINFEIKSKEEGFKKIQELADKYKDGSVDRTDGVMVEYPDWWFNLRISNTEALVRLVVEAKTPEILKEKLEEVSTIIKN